MIVGDTSPCIHGKKEEIIKKIYKKWKEERDEGLMLSLVLSMQRVVKVVVN